MATASVVSRKILIVDDNTDAAESLAALLQILGHHVRTAPDGPSALTLAEEAPPDLALLDIGLPGMDGYELAERLTALLGNRAPKLIAITGYGQASDRIRSEKSGFHSHLVKPVDFERVQTVVDELFATPQRATYPA